MTNLIHHFAVPTRDSVSSANQSIFDQFHSGIGFVPNLYATFAYSETALGDYLKLQGRKSSLSLKEKEVINLVVSQVNECRYCLAAHTLLAQKAGFSEKQTIEIRRGEFPSDTKLDALTKFVRSVAENRGRASEEERASIFDAGYTQGNVVDMVIMIGDKIITNYLHNVTDVPVDFPEAPSL
jgi:AhpD family alkylhydroperoxidase